MAITCASCGSSNLDAARFCESCGAAVRSATSSGDVHGKHRYVGDDDPSKPLVPSINVFASLYNFGFTSLVTPKLIKIFYATFVALLSLGCLVALILGLSNNAPIVIVVIPLYYIIGMFTLRLFAEFFIHVYKSSDHLYAILKELEADRLDRRAGRR